MDKKKIALAVLMAVLTASAMSTSAVAILAGGDEEAVPNVTAQFFVTNYTISTNAYAKGGATIRVNATIGNVLNSTAGYYNVTALVYNDTNLVFTVPLYNTTTQTNTSQMWTSTFTAPSYSFTSGIGNITINASYTNSTENFNQNISQYVTWRVDANRPATISWTGTNTTTDARENYVCVNVTDNVAQNYTVTFGFPSRPTDSVLSNASMARQSNGAITNTQYCYDLTPDVQGTYYFSALVYDNVTNNNESNQQYVRFAWPGGGVSDGGGAAPTTTMVGEVPTTQVPVAVPGVGVPGVGEEVRAPAFSVRGIMAAIAEIPMGMVRGVASIYDALVGIFVRPLMGIFGR